MLSIQLCRVLASVIHLRHAMHALNTEWFHGAGRAEQSAHNARLSM